MPDTCSGPSPSATPHHVTLYSYYRSSCSARLRIALNFKRVEYDMQCVDLKGFAHKADGYLSVNPSRTVPTLVINHSAPWRITQSIAALEYLEETCETGPKLLPKDPRARAAVRTLVNIIVSDVQPVTNMKVLLAVKAIGADSEEWFRRFCGPAFVAYETIVRETAGIFSYGDHISFADICLIPAVWNAHRYDVDLTSYPTIVRIASAIEKAPEVIAAHWQNQPDCPEELKA